MQQDGCEMIKEMNKKRCSKPVLIFRDSNRQHKENKTQVGKEIASKRTSLYTGQKESLPLLRGE